MKTNEFMQFETMRLLIQNKNRKLFELEKEIETMKKELNTILSYGNTTCLIARLVTSSITSLELEREILIINIKKSKKELKELNNEKAK